MPGRNGRPRHFPAEATSLSTAKPQSNIITCVKSSGLPPGEHRHFKLPGPSAERLVCTLRPAFRPCQAGRRAARPLPPPLLNLFFRFQVVLARACPGPGAARDRHCLGLVTIVAAEAAAGAGTSAIMIRARVDDRLVPASLSLLCQWPLSGWYGTP